MKTGRLSMKVIKNMLKGKKKVIKRKDCQVKFNIIFAISLCIIPSK